MDKIHFIAVSQIDSILISLRRGEFSEALEEVETIKDNQLIGTHEQLREIKIELGKLRQK